MESVFSVTQFSMPGSFHGWYNSRTLIKCQVFSLNLMLQCAVEPTCTYICMSFHSCFPHSNICKYSRKFFRYRLRWCQTKKHSWTTCDFTCLPSRHHLSHLYVTRSLITSFSILWMSGIVFAIRSIKICPWTERKPLRMSGAQEMILLQLFEIHEPFPIMHVSLYGIMSQNCQEYPLWVCSSLCFRDIDFIPLWCGNGYTVWKITEDLFSFPCPKTWWLHGNLTFRMVW